VAATLRPLVFCAILGVGLSFAAAAQSATATAAAPLLVGSYPTTSLVLVQTQNGGDNPVGYSAVRTWRFVRKCTGATCTTTLLRPSITPGSTRVIAYLLRVTAGGSYIGTVDVPDVCYSDDSPPTTVLPVGSAIDHAVITIRPTKITGGKVAAYDGTMVITVAPSESGAAQGCIAHSVERESVTSPA
jgi:hypothetical protein